MANNNNTNIINSSINKWEQNILTSLEWKKKIFFNKGFFLHFILAYVKKNLISNLIFFLVLWGFIIFFELQHIIIIIVIEEIGIIKEEGGNFIVFI